MRRATPQAIYPSSTPPVSIHALLAESDRSTNINPPGLISFYPRSPCGERHTSKHLKVVQIDVSIHALLAESDVLKLQCVLGRKRFYPRSPCGERRHQSPSQNRERSFLSTLSLRRATLRLMFWPFLPFCFYPRSPCGERLWVLRKVPILSMFLSTLSLRRATEDLEPSTTRRLTFLSTLSLRRATPDTHQLCAGYLFLSTLSLRRATRSTNINPPGLIVSITLSLRRATSRIDCYLQPTSVSIHALLAESDHPDTHQLCAGYLVSIHALLAESDCLFCEKLQLRSMFLSTLSLRRATAWAVFLGRYYSFVSIHALLAESDPVGMGRMNNHIVSIHALLAESDNAGNCATTETARFYPRSPCGERHEGQQRDILGTSFLSTLSLRRATELVLSLLEQLRRFYPRSPCGERHRRM